MAYHFDELIIAELRKENSTLALRELYKTYYPMILHLVCKNSGTEQEAKDIFQESLVTLYEKVQQPDFLLTCKVKTYLYAICRRLWLKRLYERKRFAADIPIAAEFEGIEETVSEMVISDKRFASVEKSLGSLGEPCRSIIEGFYIDEMSMEDIRDKHGYISTESAKNQKYKCLQRLKKLFFSYYKSE